MLGKAEAVVDLLWELANCKAFDGRLGDECFPGTIDDLATDVSMCCAG